MQESVDISSVEIDPSVSHSSLLAQSNCFIIIFQRAFEIVQFGLDVSTIEIERPDKKCFGATWRTGPFTFYIWSALISNSQIEVLFGTAVVTSFRFGDSSQRVSNTHIGSEFNELIVIGDRIVEFTPLEALIALKMEKTPDRPPAAKGISRHFLQKNAVCRRKVRVYLYPVSPEVLVE